MEKEKFGELAKELTSTLKMKLDAIRLKLHKGMASCMVGAGFSKNAEMDSATYMKDWFELADDFYEALYREKPKDSDVRYRSVLKLASQVVASMGRPSLESMIQKSLPDERVNPGELHINLMKLPWSDVFTTNYDTLLERASIEANRYYHKVTNKETLLYTPRPRLIKLHGSFPDIRPFIITEEDYRTYPNIYPEFVNTVRQSLIENCLCLIGFSGDDPNFLSWIGWLRDVMGKQAAPVYQITYNLQMHDSNVHLCRDLGIDVVNLADIKGVRGFAEALDFFLSYIEKNFETSWHGRIKTLDREKGEIDVFIEEMRQVRESYPGWVILPASYMKDFSDAKERIPFWESLYKQCANVVVKQIAFLYEVNWRIETALGASDIEWYIEAIKELPFDPTEGMDSSTNQKLFVLKLSLLNVYRLKGASGEYKALLSSIKERSVQLGLELEGQLIYFECLSAISVLDYERVQQLVARWTPRSSDYQGNLWKAGLLMEVGQLREAELLLQNILKLVKRNILTSEFSELLFSVRSAIELFLWRMDWTRSVDLKNLESIMRDCRDMIVEAEGYPSRLETTHGFNLLSIGQSLHFGGGGFEGDFYGAIRFFRLYEKLGLPFGVPTVFLTEFETKPFMIERLLRYYPSYALQWIVRCSDAQAIEALNRGNLLHINRGEACEFFDQLIGACEAGLKSEAGRFLQERVLKGLLPVLVRLSVLLTQDRMERLFDALCVVYRQYPRWYDEKQVTTLFDNLSGESLRRCQQKALVQPLFRVHHLEQDFRMPSLWQDEIEYIEEAGKIAVEGLSSENSAEQQAAYNRIMVLTCTKRKPADTAYLKEEVKKWRAIPPLSDEKLHSFFIFFGEESEMLSIATSELNSFLSTEFVNNHSTNFISAIRDRLFRLQIGYSRFTEEQHVAFLTKIINILEENVDTFIKGELDHFLGFRKHVEELFSYLNCYSLVDGLPSKDNEIWKSFKEVIELYLKHDFPVLTLMMHLSYRGIWDQAVVEDYITEKVFSTSRTLFQDAGEALVFLAKKERAKVNQNLVKKIIEKISYVFDERTHEFLDIIRDLFLSDGLIGETRTMLEEWLSKLPNRIEGSSIAEEIKDDIRYYANQIAGILSQGWPDSTALCDWQEYMKGEKIKNDVRNGFDIGVGLAERRLNRSSHTD